MALGLSLGACSDDVPSIDGQIRRLNADAALAVEAKDLRALANLVANDYGDERGNDKRDLLRLTQLYLRGHRDVHVFTLTKSLVALDENTAVAEVVAALAGQPVDSADQLLGIRAELVRFEVDYRRDGGSWVVHGLEWRRAAVEDFL